MLPLESYEECQWDEETKHFTFTKAIFVVNFYGTPITAALMVIQDVYNDSLLVQQLQDASHAPGKDVSNRFVYAVTGHIAQLFNFSVELIMTGDWGDRFENGSFNGLMGMIQEEKADVTVSILLPLPERATVAFPAILSLPYWTVVAFKQPRALGTYRAMILELSPGCWVLVGCVVILGAGVLAFTIKHGKEPRVKSDIPFSVGLLQSVGIMTNQGLMYLPEGNSCRTASLTMLMVGMMVLIYYNAATMTALLSESPPPIKNLEALIQSKIPFVSADAPYITILPARKKVFDDIVLARMTETMKICSEEEGIPLILNGSAFIGEHRGIFYAVNNLLKTDTICDLTMFRTGVRTTNPVFTRRCPHLREMYLRGQLRSLEHGVWQREKISWIPGWPTCTPVAKFVHVQLEAVSVALGLLLFGAWFSTMFLILEIYLHKRSIRLTSIVMLPK